MPLVKDVQDVIVLRTSTMELSTRQQAPHFSDDALGPWKLREPQFPLRARLHLDIPLKRAGGGYNMDNIRN